MASYCAACGTSLPGDARFCSSCGNAVTNPGVAATEFARGPLMRPRVGRKVAGVCQGLANQYGWDVTLTRVIAVLLVVTILPFGLLIYAVLWLTMPEEPLALPSSSHLDRAI